MAQLGQTTYYKYTQNGEPVYQAMPYGGGFPSGSGMQEVSKADYIQGLTDIIASKKSVIDQYNWQDPGTYTRGQNKINGQNFTGINPSDAYINQLQNQINTANNDDSSYRDPSFSKFQADAPTPSEQYLTPEAFASLAPREQQRLKSQYPQSYSNSAASSVPAGMKQVQVGNSFLLVKDNGQSSNSPTPDNSSPNPNAITQGQKDAQGNIINYNPKTGAKLTPGQTIDRVTGETIKPNGTNFTSGTNQDTSNNSPMFSSNTGGISYDSTLSKFGITEDIWNKMSVEQQAVVATATNASKALYSANANNVTMDTALKAAANDPTLISKYADALKIDTQTFSQSLEQIRQSTSTQSQQQQQQFESERKALAEQNAAAGTAYSGFRKQAEQSLAQNEGNIVSSSRADLQKNLNNLTTAFESKYGSAATTAASQNFLNPNDSSKVSISGLATNANPTVENLTGAVLGGITGSNEIAKKQDIQSLASSIVQTGKNN